MPYQSHCCRTSRMPPVISWRKSLKKTLKEVLAEALVNFRIAIVWAMLGCYIRFLQLLFLPQRCALLSLLVLWARVDEFVSLHPFCQDASATKSNFHLEAYSALVDLPSTTPLLQKIFGSNDYFAAGCGGDVVLAGAIATWQPFNTGFARDNISSVCILYILYIRIYIYILLVI